MTKRYAIIKKKYAAVMIIGFCFIAAGAIPFCLRKAYHFRRISAVLPLLCCTYCNWSLSFVRVLGVLEVYRILVENKEYSNRLIFKLKKKVREKVDNF